MDRGCETRLCPCVGWSVLRLSGSNQNETNRCCNRVLINKTEWRREGRRSSSDRPRCAPWTWRCVSRRGCTPVVEEAVHHHHHHQFLHLVWHHDAHWIIFDVENRLVPAWWCRSLTRPMGWNLKGEGVKGHGPRLHSLEASGQRAGLWDLSVCYFRPWSDMSMAGLLFSRSICGLFEQKLYMSTGSFCLRFVQIIHLLVPTSQP